ncbi:MAG: HD domain-containing protein [Candidatus Micrarchaeaceae archaeon]|jgi:putative hydrolases of HD superfamily
MKREQLDKILNFMIEVDKLKRVKRTGWVRTGVKDPESVADHSFSTALFTYIIAKDLKLNAPKAMLMALSHDINEVITGDIATRYKESLQVVSNKKKHEIEHKNHLRMLSYLGKKDRGEFTKLWKELNDQSSKEARLVKQIDALDYIIQLYLYSKENDKKKFETFFLTAKMKVSDPDLLYILNKIQKMIYGNKKINRKIK